MRVTLSIFTCFVALLPVSACGGGSSASNSSGAPSSSSSNPGSGPKITVQPTKQTVTMPAAATFTVAATGAVPLTYQWQNAATSVNISGATTPSYSISPTTVAESGLSFQVVVTNGFGSQTSNPATLTVNTSPAPPTITGQPTNQTATAPATATFTVIASGTPPLSYQWQNAATSADIAGATSSIYTTSPTNTGETGMKFQVVVSSATGNITSSTATLTVNPAPQIAPNSVAVLTYHNDVERTGQNLNETTLTTSNLNSTSFGLLGSAPVDGPVDAEPLYVGSLTVNGAVHNVLFVVTENDSVYAFDADTLTSLWHQSMLDSNETPSNMVDGCDQVTPKIGITSTPVIDLASGAHGTIFLVAMTKDSGGNYHQRLHALDLATGNEQSQLHSPTTIQATFSGQTFDPEQYEERSGLLLLNGAIYMGWTSHCDDTPYTGWVMGYSESTLQQISVVNVTPNGSQGGIWMAGAGLAADSTGNIYFLDGNGTFDSTPGALQANGDYGNAFIKLSTTGGNLTVSDFFATHDTVANSNMDKDLGSGGALVLPDLKDGSGVTWHLAVGTGKAAVAGPLNRIYVVNRDSMGKFNPSNDNAIYQEVTSNGLDTVDGVFAMPAYFNNTLYYGAVDDNVRAFSIVNAKLVTPAGSVSAASFGYPGTTPSISANGTSNGIVWAVQNGNTGILHAYDATNLGSELYNSTQAGNRDQFSDNKFITPMIANGKVYVGTPNSVAVFGLLSQSAKVLRKSRPSTEQRPQLPAHTVPHPGSSTPGN